MQTYTHFLWALALSKPLSNVLERRSENKLPPFQRSGFLFGSILPDLPLILTTIVFMLVDKINKDIDLVDELFRDWYFHNIWVKTEHNLFHSQITLSCMLLGAYLSWRLGYSQRFAPWFFWTLLSAWFHATCDIPVHHDDGPLIFFPFSTEYRFRSPLSYWDPNYHGREFATCEHILDFIIIIWQCWKCCFARPRSHVIIEDVKETPEESYNDDAEEPSLKQADVELAALVR